MIPFLRASGEGSMKPRARRETARAGLFKAALDRIIDLGHELVLLALAADWAYPETAAGPRVHGQAGPAAFAGAADGRARDPEVSL